MKKYLTIIKILIFIVIIGACFGGYKYHEHVEREKEVRWLYRIQGSVYPRDNGVINQYEYFDYSAIYENALCIELHAYNYFQGKSLTVEDVKEYLSNPYNEDGTLRVEIGWDKMHEYEEWYVAVGANEQIPEYESMFIKAVCAYEYEIGNSRNIKISELTVEQVNEFAKKISDSTYEINPEVMGY